eukprot:jgi/Picsp_1/4197/NSC_01706-R1_hypothetical protein CHLNCDRAFT_134848 [Chlorella variabilis]
MNTKEHSAQDFWEDQDEEAQLQEDIDREWKYRREEFRKAGLREGYEAGKQETVQQGFDQGFALGTAAGFEWGCLKGAVSSLKSAALACPGLDKDLVMTACNALEHCTPEELQNQECGRLWEEHGEMKDRFEHDQRHTVESLLEVADSHSAAKDAATHALVHGLGLSVQTMENIKTQR